MQHSSGDYDLALMGYLKAGELGYELAQVNAAWMISKGYGTPYTTDQPLQGNYIAHLYLCKIRLCALSQDILMVLSRF